MPKYRFKGSDEPKDIKRQIEDKYATYETVQEKQRKFFVVYSQPKANDYQDGDTVIYNDGTNVYKYYRAGGKLYRQTDALTEV